jgi:hypothetical protein
VSIKPKPFHNKWGGAIRAASGNERFFNGSSAARIFKQPATGAISNGLA